MNTREMRSQRAKLIADARQLLDTAAKEKRELSADEQQQWDAMLTDADKLKDEIEKRERLQLMENEIGAEPADPTTQRRAEPETSQAGQPDGQAQYAAAYSNWLRSGMQNLRSAEARALQADSDPAGGYLLAPQQMVGELIKAVDNAAWIRQFATVYQVQAADSLGAASLDADPADADWTGEITAVSADSTMAFGKRELTPHQLTKLIKVSRKLLMKVPAAERLVQDRLSYKFGITWEQAGMTGTGAGQPLGVFTASANGISTGRDVSTGNTATAIGADNLRNVKYSLNAGYRANARWIFHRDAMKMISKLVDGSGQYLWQPGIRAGDPDVLLGLPVHESEYAPNTFTAGLYVGILGDFSYYWIADAMTMDIQRLDELYAATNQVGFIGRWFSDGMPVLESAFARVTLA